MLVLLIVTVLVPVYSQVRPPQCVPKGRCFPQDPQITPRVVLPENPPVCSSAEELCHPFSGKMECGTVYVPKASDASGITSMGWHPWQVYIRNQMQKYIGSGVLVTSTHVLTVAHKVYMNKNSPKNVEIYLGVNNPFTLSAPIAIRRLGATIYIHDGFLFSGSGPVDYKNNIAIIKLDKAVDLGYRTDIGLGCLPRAIDKFEGLKCMVGGWGDSEYGKDDSGAVHKQAPLSVVSMATCKASMEKSTVLGVDNTAKFLDMKMEMCAGGEERLDACTQDGGAPLMCKPATSPTKLIAGLVNWGKGCGQSGVYGVYVDVSKYVGWINSILY